MTHLWIKTCRKLNVARVQPKHTKHTKHEMTINHEKIKVSLQLDIYSLFLSHSYKSIIMIIYLSLIRRLTSIEE
jgi:hypothetical protein